MLGALFSAPAYANPAGGSVQGGSAVIAGEGSPQVTVTQSSDRVVINWQSFSVGEGERTTFVQPSADAVALNRVTGGDPSAILGGLDANGTVVLINRNGILFGKDAKVDVGGLVATTHDANDAAFLAGGPLRFEDGGNPTATVVNEGTISIRDAGVAAFVAPGVRNDGIIRAGLGTVNLGAGKGFTLDLYGDKLISFELGDEIGQTLTTADGTPLKALVDSGGTIEGRSVYLTASAAREVVNQAVNVSGIVAADSLTAEGGTIRLGGGHGTVSVEAGAVLSATGLDGGTVEATGRQVALAGTIQATGTHGGGSVTLQGAAAGGAGPQEGPQDGLVRVEAGGLVKVTGAAGDGGSVVFAARAVLNAGAVEAGGGQDGGTILLSGLNLFQQGRLTADGAAGRGGTIGLSGEGRLLDSDTALASATGATAGGSILVQGGPAADLFLSGRYDASATAGIGGGIDLRGDSISLVAAELDADGALGGGAINVGGSLRGAADRPEASSVYLSATTTASADALLSGDGGTLVLWSGDSTASYGALTARGGAAAGDGGIVEVSSRGQVQLGGTVTAGAPKGQAGQLLLDPQFITIGSGGALAVLPLSDPSPSPGTGFGTAVVGLANGNVVVSNPDDDFAATDAGAVYLFDGTSGALLSTLTGASANDRIGSGGLLALTGGNYVVSNPYWDNGAALDAGAVTWGNGGGGTSGTVGAGNSLVGGSANDRVGWGGITLLANGNYVVNSYTWDNGAALDAGAATWGSGTSGVAGLVGAGNSLVGGSANDRVGGAGITALANGNYVVNSYTWDNGAATDAGAVTWGSGGAGVKGIVGIANSLVGTTAGDQVGSGGVTVLTNGHYVVRSSNWDNGAIVNAGAVTWGSGTAGVKGAVGAGNSLVGGSAADGVGSGGVLALSNGNYVVNSYNWDNGAVANVGAVTLGLGGGGTVGLVGAGNSLIGSKSGDLVGSGSVTALSNGNYVVDSPNWDNGALINVGAVTWRSGTATAGATVGAGNSLIGAKNYDQVGSGGVTALANGHYVVASPYWDNGAVTDVGAATWGSGTAGIVGLITSGNSLVGTTSGDRIGSGGGVALTNGNYLVESPLWDNGAAADAGAVTWGNGTTGAKGAVGSGNSLVGGQAGDQVGSGGAIALANGNYVVASPLWNNGAIVDAGAATWGSGTTGIAGLVAAGNSLAGGTANDRVGSGGLYALASGNYLVASPLWDNGAIVDAGAVTWGSGTAGIKGAVGAGNSLVGTTAGDRVGSAGVTLLTNGNYVVRSPLWDNGAAGDAGAVTWGSGTTGVKGAVGAGNSLVGSSSGDQVGSGGVTALGNGNYVVLSALWNNGGAVDAGAVTLLNGATGKTVDGQGTVNAVNSLVNSVASDTAWWAVFVDAGGNSFYVRYHDADGSNGKVLLAAASFVEVGPTLFTYGYRPGDSATISAAFLAEVLASGTAVTLQANSDITLATDLIVTAGGNGGDLTLSAGRSLLLNGSILTDGGNLTLTANDLLANGVVDSKRLPGDAVIAMAPGTWIDAGGGAVTIQLLDGAGKTNRGAGAITLGDIAANSILVRNLGAAQGQADVILDSGAVLSASGAGNALVLQGERFVNNAGAGALVTTGAGRWLVYSTTPTADTRGGLGYDFVQYAASYGGPVLGNGDGFLYSLAPSIAATLTGTVQKVYDGTTTATMGTGNYALTGLVGGDSATLASSSASYANKNAGSGKTVTAFGLTIATATDANGKPVYGYALASSSASGSVGLVTQKSLTAALTGTVQKVYDGTTTATLGSGNYLLDGVVAGDAVALNKPTTGSYGDRNAGSGKLVSVTGLALTGAAAGNYVLASSSASANIGVITQKTVTAALTGTVQKVYDGTTTATPGAANFNLAGIVAGDSGAVSVTAGAAGYGDKNVGSGKLVTATGLVLMGAEAGNYVLAASSASGNVGVITKKSVTAALTGTVQKVYNGTTAATLGSGNYLLDGVVAGDAVGLNNPTAGSYGDRNAGSGKLVSVSGLALTGAGAGNYMLASSSTSGNVGVITQKTITAALTGTVQKVYDGTTTASPAAGNYSLTGLVGVDSGAVFVTAGAASYGDKNAGSGKLVTASGLALTGAAAGNYVLAASSASGNVGVITKKTVTAALTGTVQKVYDGTATATLGSGNYLLTGALDGDAVGLNNPAAGSYADRNAGSGKLVSVAGLALTGADAGNYALASSSASGTVGIITQKTISAALTGTVQKVYDGTTTATLTAGNYSLQGLVAGDSGAVSVTAAVAAYADKNAGSNKLVTASGLTLSGAAAGNYLLASSTASASNGVIMQKSVTAALTGTVQKVYDGTTAAAPTAGNYSLTGVVSGDGGAVSVSANGASYADKNAGSGKQVTATGLSLSGAEAANYILASSSASGAVGVITPKTVTVTLVGQVKKYYDGNNKATVTSSNFLLSGVLASDICRIDVNDSYALYDNKNVGTNKLVTAYGLTLFGSDAGNYQLDATTVSARIGTIKSVSY